MALFTASQGFDTLDFQSNTPTRMTTAVSGKTHRIKTGTQFFSLRLKSPAMTRADFMADFAFLSAQEGQFGTFTVVPPGISSTRGTATNNVTVVEDSSVDPNYNNQKGSKKVGVSGGNGTLKKGDLIKFNNHDKCYLITEDINLDGSSVDVLNIFPALVSDATGIIQYNNVPIKVYQDNDEIKFIHGKDGTFRYEVTLNEEV